MLVGCAGKFPINVEAIEEAAGRDRISRPVRSYIAVDEHVDTRCGERPPANLAASGYGESIGVAGGCPTQRNQGLEFGVKLLELFQRTEFPKGQLI